MKMEDFEVRISKEELANLPVRKFVGEIVVVDNDSTLDAIMNELEKAPLVGFDTETKPTFKKGQINQVALLQIATPDKSFLIRLSMMGFHQRIKAFLEDESRLKIGLSIKDDFHNLAKLGEFHPGGFIDLQDYVRNFGIADSSLTKIHAIIFGERISKGQQLSNWEASTLTSKQKEYAALDALACIDIYKKLQSGDFMPASSPYRKEKCQEKE